MNKTEFINTLTNSLKDRKIADVDEIVSEYEQHFIFKMADGYSEEEVATRLGDPKVLAQQFDSETITAKPGKKVFVTIGLVFADFIAILFFLLLFAWVIVIVAAVVAFCVIGISLIFNLNIYNLLPSMPYFVGLIFGVMSFALVVLVAVGAIYYWLFTWQLIRSYYRWHRNTFATISREALLPGIPAHPQIPAVKNRRIRSISLIALTVFIISSLSGFIIASLTSGAFQFWHAWGWFGYP